MEQKTVFSVVSDSRGSDDVASHDATILRLPSELFEARAEAEKAIRQVRSEVEEARALRDKFESQLLHLNERYARVCIIADLASKDILAASAGVAAVATVAQPRDCTVPAA